jgi:hypothetical protein
MDVAVEVTRSDYTADDLRCHASKSVDGAQARRLLVTMFSKRLSMWTESSKALNAAALVRCTRGNYEDSPLALTRPRVRVRPVLKSAPLIGKRSVNK